MTELGVIVHYGMAQCLAPYLGHCDLLVNFYTTSIKNVQSIYLMLFDAGSLTSVHSNITNIIAL